MGHSEVDAKGISVQRGLCDAALCAACLEEIYSQLEFALSLPQTMADGMRPFQGRHFLKFSTSSSNENNAMATHRHEIVLRRSQHVTALLRAALSGTNGAGAALLGLLGPDAELCELTAVVSEPGAAEQPLHSDGYWSDSTPRLITMFLALHDIVWTQQWGRRPSASRRTCLVAFLVGAGCRRRRPWRTRGATCGTSSTLEMGSLWTR